MNYIFDFGGVLYYIDPKRTQEAIFKLATDIISEEMIKKYYSELIYNYELGQMTSNEFYNKSIDFLKLSCTEEEFITAWNQILVRQFSTAIELIKIAKNHGQVFLLSNTNEIHHNHFSPQCTELFSLFDKLFFSHQIKRIKPNLDIYQYVCDDINIDKKDLLFIDDSVPNIKAAAEFGLNTFHMDHSSNMSDLLHSVKEDPQISAKKIFETINKDQINNA